MPVSDRLAFDLLRALGRLEFQARNRPKVQKVVEIGGLRKADFRPRDLDPPNQPRSDAIALVEAARRVRNNLFHGGKEDPGEQPFDGDQDEWAEAALGVAYTLLALADQGAFVPPDHP